MSLVKKKSITNGLFGIVLALSSEAGLYAETLSQLDFRVELADGWTYGAGSVDQGEDASVNLISIHHPNQSDVLEIRVLRAAGVSPEKLRLLTNVEEEEPLEWESWGDFSGYEYSHFETGGYLRQWWLTDGKVVVLLLHSSVAEPVQSMKKGVEEMVRSLKSR